MGQIDAASDAEGQLTPADAASENDVQSEEGEEGG